MLDPVTRASELAAQQTTEWPSSALQQQDCSGLVGPESQRISKCAKLKISAHLSELLRSLGL
eukprot:6332983-Amphidinium_carterae.1